ncbi:KNR4/SMI1 homolog 2 [[Candida] jaroonii]|uniref:KNR4/SMI1 homolog 2 n=1 Tax=[Candida] jaroonii TaxID=467808 RepID=A0ACA9Y814_9ASCO|nr:KNR4/SMI1 homolog 2 [[Candida] jaroonii]
MGIFDNLKAFVHSITTEDHYASYDSPYRNVITENSLGNSSRSNLNELNNESNLSLNEGTSNFINYRPGLRSSNTNLNGSDVQLQNFRDGQPPLPSIDSLWDRFETWLDEEYPELGDNINDGVTTADLNEFESDLKCGSLPVEFRQFYKRHDGQFRNCQPTGLIMGLRLLDLEAIIEQHAIWLKVGGRIEKQKYFIQQKESELQPREGSSSEEGLNNSFISNQRSIPPNSIQPVYTHQGWVPIIKDEFGNQIALDLAPGPQGNWGQIIIFGRDFDTKLVIASNLQEFFFNYINDLENGNYKIDQAEIDSSYGYLESSRTDDDYYIGGDDDGEGDLVFWDKENEFGKVGKPLSYIEVLKRRTLKKYGINNADKFLTSFVPQPKKSALSSKVVSPQRSAANSTSDLGNLIKVNSTVNLPKETIIDEAKTEPEVKTEPEIKTKVVETPEESKDSELASSKTKPETINTESKSESLEPEILEDDSEPVESETKPEPKSETKPSASEISEQLQSVEL